MTDQHANENDRLRAGIAEACDLLAERKFGNPERSAGHNARLVLEAAIAALAAPEGCKADAWHWSQRMHDSMGGWEEKIERRPPGAWVKPEDIRDLRPLVYAAGVPTR